MGSDEADPFEVRATTLGLKAAGISTSTSARGTIYTEAGVALDKLRTICRRAGTVPVVYEFGVNPVGFGPWDTFCRWLFWIAIALGLLIASVVGHTHGEWAIETAIQGLRSLAPAKGPPTGEM